MISFIIQKNILIVILISILILIFIILYAYRTYEKEIHIEKKNRLADENKYGWKTIIDKNNNIYNTTNSIFHFHFNYKKVYLQMEENKKYKIKYYGLCIPYLYLYPNIYSINNGV